MVVNHTTGNVAVIMRTTALKNCFNKEIKNTRDRSEGEIGPTAV